MCRRKLIILLTVLSLSVLVMTVNHYWAEGEETKEEYSGMGGQIQQQQENSFHEVAHSVEASKTEDDKQSEHKQAEEEEDQQQQPKVVFQQKEVNKKDGQADPEQSTESVISSDGTRYIPHHRVFHLDLKGAPPKMSYIKSMLPVLKEAGATALLVEYEDMFPFWGALRNVSAKNAYTQKDVQNLQKWAAQNDMIVIPLVQTFGHLEFVLKLDEFKSLREVPIYPQSLCPSQDKSWTLVTEIIDQVLSLHPESAWLHIGCDEVYQLGQCSVCSEKLMSANNNPNFSGGYQDGKTLFLQHVKRVGEYVRHEKRVLPIIWDDMLRTIPAHILHDSKLGSVVEPMVWVYVEDVDRFVDSLTWANYGEVFTHIWAASAFKGAFGERLYAVNVQRHVANNLAWLEVMRRETLSSSRLSFRGLVLTGWSRYDHFAVLCELLPVAVPSLILNLVIITRGAHDYEAVRLSHKLLQCGSQKPMLTAQELRRNPQQWEAHRCRFAGSGLLGLLSSYNMNRREVESAAERIKNRDGWMTEYNVQHSYSSPWRVHESIKSVAYLPGALKTMEQQMAKSLSHFFDNHTVNEWLEQHIQPLLKQVDELMAMAKSLTVNVSWPRRPLDDATNKTNNNYNNNNNNN